MHAMQVNMHQIDLDAVDLNLLRVLDVLLDERSVSRAAQRLHRSQSAVSHALGRLREALGDPLLVRVGHTMRPTPRAEALAPELQRVLGELARILGEPLAFDPATTTRTFRLAAPDVMALLLPELLAELARHAPGADMELVPQPASEEAALASGAVDLLLAPQPAGGSLRMRALGVLEHCAVLRRGHPALTPGLDLHGYLGFPHVFVRTPTPGPSLIGEALKAQGLERRIGVTVPGFVLAPIVVARTEMIFTCPGPLLWPVAETLGLELRPAPVALPRVPVAALWHPRVDRDPGHRWFRGLVVGVLTGWLARALSP